MYEKLKSFVADDAIYLTLLVIMVGIVSFGLGQQSIVAQNIAVLSEVEVGGVAFSEAPPAAPRSVTTARPVVVSRSGTKYHLLDCPGAGQIQEENKLYFDSPAQAQAAGYAPAANCSGL